MYNGRMTAPDDHHRQIDLWHWPELLFNQVTFALRQRLAWQRGGYREQADDPVAVAAAHPRAERLQELLARYRPALVDRCSAATILDNLDVLHMLDRVRQAVEWTAPERIVALDVGAKNFYYAPALHAFWSAQATVDELVGVEVDAYRVYRNGYSRADYAAAYMAGLPGARFVAADIRSWHEPADVVTLMFPFVVPYPLIKWGLPLRLLAPEAILAHVWGLLKPGGLLIVINQDVVEAGAQAAVCRTVGVPIVPHVHLSDPIVTEAPPRYLAAAVKPG